MEQGEKNPQMYDDDVRIRPAKPEEAEDLTDIAWQSKAYWDYPPETMELWIVQELRFSYVASFVK